MIGVLMLSALTVIAAGMFPPAMMIIVIPVGMLAAAIAPIIVVVLIRILVTLVRGVTVF
jgi:hypothetical protein